MALTGLAQSLQSFIWGGGSLTGLAHSLQSYIWGYGGDGLAQCLQSFIWGVVDWLDTFTSVVYMGGMAFTVVYLGVWR